jgi:non-ribosomal peptide synthetase-like protein
VSTISSIDPDLMVFGEESFFADMAVVGAARHNRGCIFTDTTEIGRRTFIGNAALTRPGTRLKDNILIGVLSVPPGEQELLVSGSNWLGSPAIFLPRRQQCQKFDEGVTYKPPIRLWAIRLTIEFFRVVLPPTLLGTTAMYSILVALWLARGEWIPLPLWAVTAILPLFFLVMAFAMYLVIVLLKWIIIGRYQKHVAPLWSHFVWRSEFITAMYESAAVPALLAGFQGTPFLGPLLRLLGARIGSRVYLETTYITEFDLVEVGNDSSVGGTVSLQTHLFEDRVMKMDVVNVGKEVSIGPRSIVLYGCHVEDGADIDGLSLVMKGERIPRNTMWRGIPCGFVGRTNEQNTRHTGSTKDETTRDLSKHASALLSAVEEGVVTHSAKEVQSRKHMK